SGIALACVDNEGQVHPDQFSWHITFGNVRERPFGEIWTDTSHPELQFFKNRQPHLKGRCARCRFLEICNGNLRVRAEMYYGDRCAPDPACYLREEEIAP
ncbi:MAG TPA: SPASM domain-containing protein, partial [Armatimonadetes bacterium]|nr:SPASM domain-containing protein [Armatimonadota bacterium]